MENSLDKEVERRLLGWYKVNKAWLLIGIFANLVGFVLLFLYYKIIFDFNYAFKNTFEAYSGWLIPQAVLLILYVLYLSFLKMPSDIYKEQREIIINHAPNQLNIFVGQSFLPSGRWRIEEDRTIHTTCLTVISQEKKKLLEFHATRLEFLQRTGDMKPEIRGAIFASVEKNLRFEWKNGEVFTEILPGDQAELILAELDPLNGYPVFGKSRVSSIQGKKPSIYELAIQFKGRRSGEDDFAYFNYRTKLYCHPENDILDFADDSPDILDDLKSKIFFANKTQDE